MKAMKAMIVDDSLMFREILHQELERDVNIKVVAKAADAFDAGKRIVEHKPDVLIVDVIMDKLNGIDFVKQLLPQYYLPVIIVSSDHAKRAEAESIPKVAFVEKPKEADLRRTQLFFSRILTRIRAIANQEEYSERHVEKISDRIMAIGASTGGAEAIETVLKDLPSAMPPIVISQHMPPKFTKSFAERLNSHCRLSVKEAEDGDLLIPGQVYIAPGGYHMSVRSRNDRYVVSCEENVSGSPICPSVDVLFHSVATAAGRMATGVLLTGMGRDGADGLAHMRRMGANTIGQDEASSVVYGMPKAAYDLGAVETQLSLQRIAKQMTDLAWA